MKAAPVHLAVLFTVALAGCQEPSSSTHGTASSASSASPLAAASAPPADAGAHPAAAATHASPRSATGTVSVLQSHTPSTSAHASAFFYDTMYGSPADAEPCPPASTSVPGCTVKTCPYPPQSSGSHTTRPSAGTISVSVDPHVVRLEPGNGWYPGQPSIALLHGGELVKFDAVGDAKGVPAFSGQVVAPVFVALAHPEWASQKSQARLLANTAFEVAWSPSSPNGNVRVELVAPRDGTQTHVLCEFDAKNGKGIIPADAVGHLSAGTLVFTIDAVASTVVTAGAFAVTLQVSDSVLSGTAQLVAN